MHERLQIRTAAGGYWYDRGPIVLKPVAETLAAAARQSQPEQTVRVTPSPLRLLDLKV